MLNALHLDDPKRSRAAVLGRVFVQVAGIAFADALIKANVPLGLLYIAPMAFAGTALRRRQLLWLAVACAALAEFFDGFPWVWHTAIPRDLLYLAAFAGSGLLVHEALANRRRSLLHLREVETEVAARREAEEQLHVLVASSPIAILTMNSLGEIVLANEAADRLLLVAPGSLAGQRADRFLPALTNVPAFHGGQLSLRTVMQCPGRRADGEGFLAEVWFSTYATSAGPRLTAMIADTSQDLRDREEANLHQMLTGSRILAGAVSHEVRNVCGAIAVVHQNLSRSGALAGSKDFVALGTLVLALERIASLELRESAERPAEIDPAVFLEELRVVVSSGLRERGIEDRWEVAAELPAVWADRQSLIQVFLNLLRNSEAALAGKPVRRVLFRSETTAKSVCVSVVDSGGGVENADLLFRPFQRSARRVGLGLYLSRALMRSFRGDLRFEPSPEGTTFVVELSRVGEALDVAH